jgi:hypothetical protein
MPSRKSSSKQGGKATFVIGSARFRKISAVEGIAYSAKMKGGAAIASTNATTPAERRAAIVEAYRKK